MTAGAADRRLLGWLLGTHRRDRQYWVVEQPGVGVYAVSFNLDWRTANVQHSRAFPTLAGFTTYHCDSGLAYGWQPVCSRRRA